MNSFDFKKFQLRKALKFFLLLKVSIFDSLGNFNCIDHEIAPFLLTHYWASNEFLKAPVLKTEYDSKAILNLHFSMSFVVAAKLGLVGGL